MAKAAQVVGAKLTPQQLNAMQRQSVLAQSVEMIQQIYSQTFSAIPAAPIAVVPRNVGLVKRFIVVVTANIANTDVALDLTQSDMGLSNLLSNVTFVDLQNNTRINTSGWHLAMLATLKRQGRAQFGGGQAPITANATDLYIQSMFNAASVAQPWEVIQAPGTIVHATNKNVRGVFEIPVAYSDDDLRGALYMNVVNATAQLNLTLAPLTTMFALANKDTTLAVYGGTQTVTVSNITVTVYQVYLDQLPRGNNGIVLPVLDLSTVYELKNTPFTAIPAGQDFPFPYANFRDFLSTTVIYNDKASDNTGRKTGADVNYWALQSANFTNILKLEPLEVARRQRSIADCDLPSGVYHFSHRKKPLSTLQYGNMQLVLNASSADVTAYALVGWEDFALINTLTQAGSLAG